MSGYRIDLRSDLPTAMASAASGRLRRERMHSTKDSLLDRESEQGLFVNGT